MLAFEAARNAHATLLDRRNASIKGDQERERERALLVFESEELLAASPRVGEADDLAREAHRLGNAEQVRAAARAGFALLYESDRSAQGLLEKVARSLAPLADAVPEFADAAADLERLADEAREVAYALRRFDQGWDDDPDRLEEVETRLALYRRLSTRYRCSPDDLAARLDDSTRKLAAIETAAADLVALDEPIQLAWLEVARTGEALTLARRKGAEGFARAVQVHLKALGLGEARLSVNLATTPDRRRPVRLPKPRVGVRPGRDPVHPERRRTGQAAPQGRIGRRVVPRDARGGRPPWPPPTACRPWSSTRSTPESAVDWARRSVASSPSWRRHHQVICVTHLPQVASYADHQWIIRKRTEGGRTRTTITPLDEAGRVVEIAAMLRGDAAAEGTRQEAVSMLAEARVAR